jgi:hypothetical protein
MKKKVKSQGVSKTSSKPPEAVRGVEQFFLIGLTRNQPS